MIKCASASPTRVHFKKGTPWLSRLKMPCSNVTVDKTVFGARGARAQKCIWYMGRFLPKPDRSPKISEKYDTVSKAFLFSMADDDYAIGVFVAYGTKVFLRY